MRSGSAAVAVGALICTCWPRKVNAVGTNDAVVWAIETVPPDGAVTAVSTGLAGVAPSPSRSVERVPPGEESPSHVLGALAGSCGDV